MTTAPVICLHGFPEQPSAFDDVAASLRGDGFDVHVPSQRGYDPAHRPLDRRSYATAELATDVLRYADANGIERFHLVGHDWGAGLAWWLAAHVPERLVTMTSLAVPHPRAMRAVALRSTQLLKSYYIGLFRLPGHLPERALLAGGGTRFRDALQRSGLSAARAEEYVRAMSEPGALTAAINWYRGASPQELLATPDITDVPVLYVWGSEDLALSRAAAEATTRFVRSRYRFLPLEGASHWLPQEHSALFLPALVEHLRRNDVT